MSQTESRSDSATDADIAHHELPVHEVVLLLETDAELGLSQDEADSRLARLGPNSLPSVRQRGWVARLLYQFHNWLIYILLAAALATALLGQVVDTVVILGVVIINAIIGFVQETQAGQALRALRELTATTTSVVRDGRRQVVAAKKVVPGDLVVLEVGDKIPADVRLTDVAELRTDESSLTGESLPVHKRALRLPAETDLGDRLNMAYASTLVSAGRGSGIVVATGADTEIGHIHRLVGEAEGVDTPLSRKLDRFSKWLAAAIVALAIATFVLGFARGESAAYMVTAAVALAVGAIPEGLPAAVTITLAIGVTRMARRQAIMRSLGAAETLGSTTVICTDKTGTLTENRMTVEAVNADGRTIDLGERAEDPQQLLAQNCAAVDCLAAGALCNDAQLGTADSADSSSAMGDPTEVALLRAAERAGLAEQDLRTRYPRVDALPFESERRYMATLHRRDSTGEDAGESPSEAFLIVKGAVEVILPMCSSVSSSKGASQPLDQESVLASADEFASSSLRVLALARAQVPMTERLSHESLTDHDFELLGLVAMMDPPRAEALGAVSACRGAGISVKMITGDHAATAQSIAARIGLAGADSSSSTPEVLTGAQLAACSSDELAERLQATAVFARVSAEQKLRIVEGLQASGQVVAMTGDGVNDAPALRQSDIGVAMGDLGTEVAKESADMILVDDNFATIESAVEEGRGLFDNLTKFITWTLPTNFAEGLVVLVAIAFGAVLPIVPVQILWINTTTAVALGLMLAFEPREPGIMKRPPRRPNQPLLTRALMGRIVLVGAIMLVSAYGLFAWDQANGGSLERSQTVAVNTFVMIEIFYLLNCRSLHHSVRHVGFFSNRAALYGIGVMVVLQLLLTYAPPMNALFDTAPLPGATWLVILAVGLVAYGIVGLEKQLRLRTESASAQT